MRKPLVLALFAIACRAAQAPAPTAPAPSDRPYVVANVPGEWLHRSSASAVTGARGAVSSDAALASQVGIEILRSGGNAVDAAIAVGFALAVVYPEAGNLGGGGFTVLRMADGRVAAIDYREVAPLAATRGMFLDDSGRVARKSVVGPLASGVPGSVAGMVATHQRFGALPLARVMAPSIRLADEGFAVDSQLARSLASHVNLIGQFAGASVFVPNGQPLAAGTRLRQPALARTLRAIADSGAASFYTGALARVVAEDLRAAGSIITAQDLANYKVEWREPIRATYRGHVLITMPPPSSGATMVEALNILEGFAPLPPFGSARHAHLLASSLQRAFVDRNALLADPAFARVPVNRLTDKSYAAKLRASVGDRAMATGALVSLMSDRPGPQTTHYSVVDAAGNAVATTTTINDLYGSGVYLPNVGIFMNDEMDDFAARPGQPNEFGLVQGEQNAIEPGKRMLSSMLPTIVLERAGRPFLVLGARGGPRIISGVMQTIVNVIDHQMSLPDAINAPRMHHQALPDTLRYERGGFATAVLDSLAGWGYGLRPHGSGAPVSPPGNLGSVNGIMRTSAGWIAYSDPRSGGRPAGY
jgi:gamma-glutamyltranspeptidase/glutathione hydrolase